MTMRAQNDQTNPVGTDAPPGFSPPSTITPCSLIVGGVRSDHEKTVEEKLGCLNQALWLRCENGLVWDPYGSLMRTLLMILVRFSTIQTIYVVAASPDRQDEPAQNTQLINLASKVSGDTVSTIHFLLQYYYGIHPEDWLQSDGSTTSHDIATTLRVIRDHPLLPGAIPVKGFLFEAARLVLHPVGE